MQLFINNWSAVLTAPATASAVQLSIDPAQAAKLVGLGSGDYYLLTLALVDAGGIETEWETAKVTAVSSGEITVVRGQEGSSPLEWAAGSPASVRVTAGTLARLRDAAQAGGGSPTIIGTAYPDVVPPAIGAHYLYEGAVFVAVGNAAPEHWVQVAGLPVSQGSIVSPGVPSNEAVHPMTRLIVVNAGGAPGDTLPAALFTLPAWEASPGVIELWVIPEVTGLTVNVDLDFGPSWAFVEFFVAPSPVYTVSRAGNLLSLTVAESARVSLLVLASAGELYVEMRAAASARLVSL